jgi:hypothetical protein
VNPSVDVIVPWRGGCDHRSRAWAWVGARYAEVMPEARLVLAPAPAGPWCKGKAVAEAAALSTADVAVVADADVWCDDLPKAVAEVAGGTPWAIPHDKVLRLTADATVAVYDGAPWSERDVEQRPYTGLYGGGIVALTPALLRAVPIDPRFFGWGQEDESWGLALHVLLGPPWRGDAPLLHLWHPPQERLDRRRGSREGWYLRRRYMTNRDPEGIAALLEEAHEHLRSNDPNVHAPPSRAER